jgi:outer membrane protein assembly factor BamB
MKRGLALAGIAAATVAGWACVRPPPSDAAPAHLPGCGKDTDCKGTRICQQGACVEPPAPRAIDAAPAPAPPTALSLPDGSVPFVPAIALPGASPLFHVDWAHSGRSRFRVSATAPAEIARIPTGGVVVSSPAVADDGTAYFGSHDRSVRAVSGGPGDTVRWTRTTGDLVWCSPALGPGPQSSVTVYVGSDDDRLYALDAASGAVRWTFTAGPCKRALGVGPEAARCDVDGVTVGPDGTIYAVADGAYGLNPDGTLRFRFALRTHCAGAPAVGVDGTILFGCQDGALYALAPDGAKRWEFRAGGDVDSSPAVAPDGTIYFGADDRKLYALTPGGILKWSLQTGGDVRTAPALAADGTIYAGAFDGALYAVRPNGTVAWAFRAADRILSSPVVDAAGLILFGSQDDRLYALSPDGKLAWSVLLGGDVDGTPAIGPDGTIYVGADDKALHVLK